MQRTIKHDELRVALMDAINEHRRTPMASGAFTADTITKIVREKLSIDQGSQAGFVLLMLFNELLRSGIVAFCGPYGSWSSDTFCLTSIGIKSFEQISRDPLNSTGYLSYLQKECPLDDITLSYVEEAVATYRTCCYKGSAILIGAAAENLVLNLRDELMTKLKAKGETPHKDLNAFQVKTVLEKLADKILADLKADVTATKDNDTRLLLEDAEARLRPLAAEFRSTRNAAGHPAMLAPVEQADVHASLLLFPSTAKLIARLKIWVISYYK